MWFNIMFWGCFLILRIRASCHKLMKQNTGGIVPEENLLQFANKNFTLQQDNGPKHKAKAKQDKAKEYSTWPGQITELKPTENLHCLKIAVNKHPNNPKNLEKKQVKITPMSLPYLSYIICLESYLGSSWAMLVVIIQPQSPPWT